jgi:hypothetical protein
MKAVCPISGIPFRTYDSLPVKVSYVHPIFSLTYDQLIYLLDIIREQDEELVKSITTQTRDNYDFMDNITLAKKLTDLALEAISERNYNNPVFKLYQTKSLTMLAFMKLANLLENEEGYNARPTPSLVSAYFWQATELFIWANTIRNPYMIELLPKYRVSKHNEDMGNFREYINILTDVKNDISRKYRSMSEESKLKSMEYALSILSKRRNVYNIELTKGNNKLAAQWALMITRPPKDMYDFWFAILSSPSMQITFEGVNVNGKMEIVHASDLRELKDFLEDNLIGPRGNDKSEKATHEDDSEHYFVARQTVLGIVRKHITILEQGTSSYQIINVALGSEILSATDDILHEKAIEAGLTGKPSFVDYTSLGKMAFMKAMAKWRLSTRQSLLDLANMTIDGKVEEEVKQEKGVKNYEIL